MHTMQDALLDEEGATPADGFSGDANAVSLRLPQAKAETKQRMQTAEEAHEVSSITSSPTALHAYIALCLLTPSPICTYSTLMSAL